MKKTLPATIIMLALLVGNAFVVNSQKLQVFDFTSGIPIDKVALFNKNRTLSVITDQNGYATLDAFSDTDSIFFQHPSFQMIILTKDDLRKAGFKIYLNREIRMLEEFIISVSKWEQNKREIPNKIKMLSAREIQFHNPQTAADLLGISNEVFIQKSQLGGGSPMIRGFSANSVLIVVDGVRMNNAIYRSGNLHNVISLDANSIVRSEVIFGPGSVVYGSDALGGVMDFHTRWVAVSSGEKPELSVNFSSRYSSANKEKTGHLDFNIGGKKLAFMSSVTLSNYDDLRMGSRKNPDYQRPEYAIHEFGRDTIVQNDDPDVQRFSGYDQINIIEKIRFRPNENLNLIYAFHYSGISEVPRYDRLTEYSNDQLKYAVWKYGPQKWLMHTMNINYDKVNAFFSNGQLTFAYQDYEESRIDRKFGKSGQRKRTERVDVLSLNLDFDKSFRKENTIFYGIETVFNKVKSDAFEKDIHTGVKIPVGTRYPDGDNSYNSFATYISYKNNISELLTLNTGIRYSYINLHSTFKDTSIYHFSYDVFDLATGALNGSAGMVFRPKDNWQINLNTASGFRAPNLDDVGKIFDSEPGNVVVPNKNLKPEYTYNLDLGTVVNFTNNGSFELTGFITLLRDVMVRREFSFNGLDSIMYDGTLSKVYALVNSDKALIYGGNVSLGLDLTRFLNFSGTLTYMYGEDQDGIPLRHVPPLFGSIHFMLMTKYLNLDMYTNFNGEKPNSMLAPSEIAKIHMYAIDDNGNPYSPKWFTLNMKASCQITSSIHLNAGIENILDHRYRPYSSGIVAPGRNFYFAFRLTI
ncbi:MAG: TonB-dependent receptor [Bacteroidales bacterium]|nr:MAG: TonB-dependent receptor [Bacteroidales bacterium]